MSGRLRKQSHDRQRDRRLARAGFPYHAQGFPLLQGKGDIVDRLYNTVLGLIVNDDILKLK